MEAGLEALGFQLVGYVVRPHYLQLSMVDSRCEVGFVDAPEILQGVLIEPAGAVLEEERHNECQSPPDQRCHSLSLADPPRFSRQDAGSFPG